MALTLLFRLLFVAYAEDQEVAPLPHECPVPCAVAQAEGARSSGRDAERNVGFDQGTSHWREVWGACPRPLTRVIRNGGCRRTTGSCSLAIVRIASPALNLTKIKLPNSASSDRSSWRYCSTRTLLRGSAGGFPQPWGAGIRHHLRGTVGERAWYCRDRPRDWKRGRRPSGETEGHGGSGGWQESIPPQRIGRPQHLGPSFFTKPFGVEHLITYSLEPALAADAARLDAFEDEDVAEAFFDPSVWSDIAMVWRV